MPSSLAEDATAEVDIIGRRDAEPREEKLAVPLRGEVPTAWGEHPSGRDPNQSATLPSKGSFRSITSRHERSHAGSHAAGSAKGLSPGGSGIVRFFDAFFRNWFLMDPSVDLIFTDIKSRSSVMARMISFMCKNCDKLDRPDIMKAIERVTAAHVRVGVKPRHYDHMAKSMLLTLKQTIGLAFTADVQKAWVMAFSWFFQISFARIPIEIPVLVKAPPPPSAAQAASPVSSPSHGYRFVTM